LLHLGEISVYTGDDEQARPFLEQALAIAREIKYQETESDSERLLGQVAFQQADLASARHRFERALEVCRAAGDKRGEATTQWWLGKADIAEGATAPARQRLGEALQSFRDHEMRAEMIGCIEDHARLARLLGLAEEAVRLCAAVASLREKLALRRAPRSETYWRSEVHAARQALGAAFDAAWAEGSAWELKDAIDRALRATKAAAMPA
jgi:hypothetical protein